MNDQQIIERIADFYRSTARTDAEALIEDLASIGLQISSLTAPEPTYTIRLSEKQRGMVVESVISKNNPRWSESQEGEDAWDELYEMIISTLPDQEPGA